jgi:ATP-dependent Lon protease
MFITTANMLDTIAPPLRDRMEMIRISGYTNREKVQIAKRHLVPRQIVAHGLKKSSMRFQDPAIERIIEEYTRESGLRNLEREIGGVCRKVARSVATRGGRSKTVVTPSLVARHLGQPRFQRGDELSLPSPGVVVGLAWTPHGGELLHIEASRYPGKGNLKLTGQLGDVMKESAQAALTYLRSNAARLNLDPTLLKESDIHIHVPEGAIPKDGPSAGVTICTALASLMRSQKPRKNLAMTGEITLQGHVLPVGGIREKVLAAHRAGVERVLIPMRNKKDVREIPPDVRKQLEIRFVSRMPDVLRQALPK